MTDSPRLDQLTALRFFAAFMIVIHHCVGLFGIRNIGVNFGQGVSFFFVLSGFILAYVYPSLDTTREIRRFWRARIARIWPAYLACFAIGLYVVPYTWDTKTGMASLFMLQGWIPLSSYYFSYNPVAWSVSTEAFFYLAFPLLLYRWNRHWSLIFLFFCGALAAWLLVVDALHLPEIGNPWRPADKHLLSQVTQHGLVYISPVSRIFEFILGMVVATLFRMTSWSVAPFFATILEIGAVVVCALAMYYGYHIVEFVTASSLSGAGALWVTHSGAAFAFGLLIYVMARGLGMLSRVLSNPFPVLLGEISFSLYLIHPIVLALHRRNLPYLAWLPASVSFIIVVTIMLLSSYLLWAWIEMPGRRILLGGAAIHGTAITAARRRDYADGKKPLLAGLALASLIGLMYCCRAYPYA